VGAGKSQERTERRDGWRPDVKKKRGEGKGYRKVCPLGAACRGNFSTRVKNNVS